MAGRFRSPKSKEQEASLVAEATPKSTQYNTKWGIKVFEEWQNERPNKIAKLEHEGVAGLRSDDVEDLTVNLEHVAQDLKLLAVQICWRSCKKPGDRYPPKTLYLLVCAINRHLIQEEKMH